MICVRKVCAFSSILTSNNFLKKNFQNFKKANTCQFPYHTTVCILPNLADTRKRVRRKCIRAAIELTSDKTAE